MYIHGSSSMRNDKHIALKFRKQGKSYNKISKELGVAKSTLSDWFSEVDWSQEIKKDLTRKANYISRKRLQLINKERREMWERWREDARQQARKDFPRLQNNPLFIAGLMIYWGEGDSKVENGNVRVSNTSSAMLRVYYLFLQGICHAPKEKIKAAMVLYPDLSEQTCKQYWSSTIGIPESQFTKTQFIEGKHPTKRLTYGIGMLSFSSRATKEKISVWIDLFHKKFP
jgi:hypothetical protein